MRVTETRMIETASEQTSRQRSRVQEASDALQTGVRVDRPSDGVTDWAEGMRAEVRHTMSERRGNAVARANERLGETDRALSGIGEGLSRVRELTVQAANDTYTAAQRSGIAQEVQALRAHMLGLANTQGPDGEFLLAGTAGNAAPFGANGVYVGNGTRRQIEASEGHIGTFAVTGQALTTATGVDVFTTLDNVIASLNGNDGDAIRANLNDLSTAVDQVANARTELGSQSAALDVVDSARRDFEVELARMQERAIGIDPVDAATDFARASAALDSARAVAERIVAIALGR